MRVYKSRENRKYPSNNPQKENGTVGLFNREASEKIKEEKKELLFKIIRNDQ
jgi:hypothetical protein